jgi:hypothetical protein
MNNMFRMVVPILVWTILSTPISAAEKDDWYAKAVKSVAAKIEPAEAKAGQTVTFNVTIELNEGFYTYPLKQVDENAKSFVNKMTFPKPDKLIFVGDAIDPDGFDKKSEPVLMIDELRTYKNSVTYSRKAVVAPGTMPGEVALKLESFKLSVCDASNCFPPKTLMPEAKLTVIAGSVDVAKEFADEVKKAMQK